MSALAPTSASFLSGAGRLRARAVAAVFALLLAAPLTATVWTRSTCLIRIPKGGQVELENASYAARDWNVALKTLEVKEEPGAEAGAVVTVWVFHYTNTDTAPHYVTFNVRCLDAARNERTRFAAKATLQGSRPNGDRVEVRAKVREGEWTTSSWAKVLVDFLSSPEG